MTVQWYSNLPIANKLRLIIMSGGLAFVICFGLIYTYYGSLLVREKAAEESANIANLIGTRNVAAIRFRNSESAASNLEDMSGDKTLEHICLYNMNAEIFASYPVNKACPAAKKSRNGMFEEVTDTNHQKVTIMRNIVANGEIIGAIGLVRNQNAVLNYVMNQLKTMVVIIFICTAIGYFIADYLQKFISEPIRDIAQNAQELLIDSTLEYRTLRGYGGELGKIAQAFNHVTTQMETKIRLMATHNAHIKKSHNLAIERLEELMGDLAESVESFNAYSEMTTQNHLGNSIDEYIPYQKDVLLALGIYATNFETFVKDTKIYAESVAGEKTAISLRKYIFDFSKKIKNTTAFVNVEFLNNPSSEYLDRLYVFRAAWDEVFKILGNFYTVISGIIEFSPQLKIEIIGHAEMLVFTLYGKDSKPGSKPLTSVFEGFNFDPESEALLYEKNTIDDPSVADEFLTDGMFERADMRYIIDSIKYIANANSVGVQHTFEPEKFILKLDISKVAHEAEKYTTACLELQ